MNIAIAGLLEADALIRLIDFARYFLTILLGYYFMRKLLPNRMNMAGLIAVSLIYGLWFILRSNELLGTKYHLWMNVFVNALSFFVLIFLFKEKFWKRFIVYCYFQVILVMCETISYVPISLYFVFRGYQNDWSQIISLTHMNASTKTVYISFAKRRVDAHQHELQQYIYERSSRCIPLRGGWSRHRSVLYWNCGCKYWTGGRY